MDLRNRILELTELDTSELRDNEGNWRAHPASQRGALAAIIGSVGVVQPLLVYNSERQGGLTLIDGHLRKGDYPGRWPVLVLDLDDSEADVILASLDPLAAMAQAIPGQLQALVKQAKVTVDDHVQQVLDQIVAVAGSELQMMSTRLLVDYGPRVEAKEVQQALETWEPERGAVWAIPSLSVPGREHRLMCGDSLEERDLNKLTDGRVADMCCTDPPYGIEYDPGNRGKAREEGRGHKFAGGILGDKRIFSQRVWLTKVDPFYRGAIYVCGCVQMYPEVWTWMLSRFRREPTVIVWVKEGFTLTRRDYHRQHEFLFHDDPTLGLEAEIGEGEMERGEEGEFIFYSWNARRKWLKGRREADVWRVRRVLAKDYRHPNQKPVELARRAILNSCPQGGVVADYFCGSGFTLVGAEQTGRLCQAMEIDERFVAVTLARLAEAGLEPYRLV